jgi:hypothetical protein
MSAIGRTPIGLRRWRRPIAAAALASGPALAEEPPRALDTAVDFIAFCRPAAAGCDCSLEEVETLIALEEQAQLLSAIRRGGRLSSAELAGFARQRLDACDQPPGLSVEAAPQARRRVTWRSRGEGAP